MRPPPNGKTASKVHFRVIGGGIFCQNTDNCKPVRVKPRLQDTTCASNEFIFNFISIEHLHYFMPRSRPNLDTR